MSKTVSNRHRSPGRHRAQISDPYFRHLEHVKTQDTLSIGYMMIMYRTMIGYRGASTSHRPRYGSIPYWKLYLAYAPMWPDIA